MISTCMKGKKRSWRNFDIRKLTSIDRRRAEVRNPARQSPQEKRYLTLSCSLGYMTTCSAKKMKSPHDWNIEKILLYKPNKIVKHRLNAHTTSTNWMVCGTVPHPKVPCTLRCLERAFLTLSLPVYFSRLSSSVLQFRVILIKMAVFHYIFVTFKSGSFRILTCFEKYFVFHD